MIKIRKLNIATMTIDSRCLDIDKTQQGYWNVK